MNKSDRKGLEALITFWRIDAEKDKRQAQRLSTSSPESEERARLLGEAGALRMAADQLEAFLK